MTGSLFLQIFLLINVFLIGALTAVAIRHAYAHFRPTDHDAEKHRPDPHVTLPPAVKARLLEKAESNFQHILDQSAKDLEHELKHTANELNKQLHAAGLTVIQNETDHHQSVLEKLREQTEAAFEETKEAIAKHQADLKERLTTQHDQLESKLAAEVAVEKEHLLQQIDTKLSDAVASFLIDTLQHNVDLGAQTPYLTAMLEEHKAELAKGIHDEA